MPLDPIHILLVDDRAENLTTLEALLTRDGLSVLKATSGAQALELLLIHDMALAILDVQMPGMDGFELAELMRGTERTRQVPIIFITAGDAGKQRRFRGYEMGGVDFLAKPIEPDILRSKTDVFVDLYRQRQKVIAQRDALEIASQENARLLAQSRDYAAALKEASAAKSDFLATMSHEIRTPMNVIIGLGHILKLSQPLTGRQQECIATLQSSAEALLTLINDLLDISRIESGSIELEHIPFDLDRLIGDVAAMMQIHIGARPVILSVDYPGPQRMFSGDPARIRQILINLCSNAAKFTERGTVRMTVSLGDAMPDGRARVHIAVRDTGIGIPPENLDKIFEKFTQADASINRKYGGTGLGLAICRSLVHLMGGSLTVDSTVGQGSTFTLNLPLSTAD